MNNISNILRNPLVKIIGTIIILYYALFYNNKNPESVANRFSSDSIHKNIDTAKHNSNSIIMGIQRAQMETLEKQKQATAVPQNNVQPNNNTNNQ